MEKKFKGTKGEAIQLFEAEKVVSIKGKNYIVAELNNVHDAKL